MGSIKQIDIEKRTYYLYKPDKNKIDNKNLDKNRQKII